MTIIVVDVYNMIKYYNIFYNNIRENVLFFYFLPPAIGVFGRAGEDAKTTPPPLPIPCNHSKGSSRYTVQQ